MRATQRFDKRKAADAPGCASQAASIVKILNALFFKKDGLVESYADGVDA